MGYEWLALCAAFLWAVSSLISVVPAQHLGAFAYSRWRMGCTAVILSTMAWSTGGLAKCLHRTYYANDGVRFNWHLYWRYRIVRLFESHGITPSRLVVFLPCGVLCHLGLLPI